MLFQFAYSSAQAVAGSETVGQPMTTEQTRSQDVARIADRTASQHLHGSRDVIGHVTIR